MTPGDALVLDIFRVLCHATFRFGWKFIRIYEDDKLVAVYSLVTEEGRFNHGDILEARYPPAPPTAPPRVL